jgi:SAM-dependent methyltransferase
MIKLLINILYHASFWFLLLMLVWQAYNLIFNRGVPNIRTAPAIRKKIIEILKADCAVRGKKPYTIIDLGSGNGLLTREIARAIPDARVIGIEISAPQAAWALLQKEKQKLDNLSYERADFLVGDLSQADAVVFYLVATLMESVGKKLHTDCKPGTLVISNRFRLGDGWRTDQVIEVKTLYPHQKKVNVYRR